MRLFLMILGVLLFTQTSFSQEYVKLSASASKKEFQLSEKIKITLKASIQEGYHINANKTSDEDLIPTTVKVDEKDFKVVSIGYPPAKNYKFSFSETELQVYEGAANISITLKAKNNLKSGKYDITGTLHYQACNDRACFSPKDAEFTVSINLKEDSAKTLDTLKKESRKDTSKTGDTTAVIKKQLDTLTTQNKTETKKDTSSSTVLTTDENQISGSLKEKGIFLTLLLIFLGGLALNLTPCVYPLIPITISFFGAKGTQSKLQRNLNAVIYVLGMSVTYSVLGLVAALTGGLFGSALQNPIVVIIISLIMLGLSLSMFGVYEIRVPQSLALFSSKSRSGYFGTALMGLTVGIIAAPCIGPFVLSLLVYVGQIGNAFIGFLFFFVLSIGLGVPYIFLALFSGSISKLPRSGEWMEGVKIIFGLILIGLAIYTLQTLIPPKTYNIVFPVYVILAGVYLILVDKKALKSVPYTKVKYIIAIGAIIYGSLNLNLGASENQITKFEWQNYRTKADIEKSISSAGKPTMIDFTADWCAACKELEKYTYTNPDIIDKAKQFNVIKVDLTKDNKEISDKFSILGLPVVAFIDKNGNEIKNLRVTGFVKPEEFSRLMDRALK